MTKSATWRGSRWRQKKSPGSTRARPRSTERFGFKPLRSEVALAKQAQRKGEARQAVDGRIADHRRARRRPSREGRKAERPDQRRLHLECRPAPERLAGHDDARNHPDGGDALAVGDQRELLNPTTEKSQAVKSQRDDPVAQRREEGPEEKGHGEEQDPLQPHQAQALQQM